MKKFIVLFLVVALLSFLKGHVFAETEQNYENTQNRVTNNGGIVEGTIVEGGHPAANVSLVIVSNQSKRSLDVITDNIGTFKTKLPDGGYTVKAIRLSHSNEWFSTQSSFTVTDGKIKNKIVITKKKPIRATIKNTAISLQGLLTEGNQGISGELLVLRAGSEEEEPVSILTKNDGTFSGDLADGEYFIPWVILNDEFFRLSLSFSIVGKNLFVNGQQESSLNISIPVKKYSGVVHDSSKPIDNAYLTLSRIITEQGESYPELIQSVPSDNQGKFSLREIPDGNYELISEHETFRSLTEFSVKNGKLLVNDIEVSALDIAVDDFTLAGTVLDGSKPVGNVSVLVAQLKEGEISDTYWFKADRNGKFKYRLPDGNYSVIFIKESLRDTKVDIPFTIKNGALLQDGKGKDSLSVVLPPINFMGKLVENNAALQASLEIDRLDVEEFYSTSTNEKGIFSLRLPDGEYAIYSTVLSAYDEIFRPFVHFEISGGKLFIDGVEKSLLEINVPPINVSGNVMDGGTPIDDGRILFASLHDEPLEFFKIVNDDGSYNMRLADGNYEIVEVHSASGGIPAYNLHRPFSIQDGHLYIDGQPADQLNINLPSVTLNGILHDDSHPLNGEVLVTSGQAEYWGFADDEGKFQIRLPDGDYQVQRVNLLEGTSEFTTVSSFRIQSGQLYIDGKKADQLGIMVPPVTLSGNIYDGDIIVYERVISVSLTDADGNAIKEYLGWTDFDGRYQFRLKDGQYLLNYVDTYVNIVHFNKPFSIKDGKLIFDGQETDHLDINLQDGLPQGEDS